MYRKREILKMFSGRSLTVDSDPPVITLIGGSFINLEEGDPYTEQGATAFDAIDGDITADAKNFDLEFDRIALTCGGAFFNLPEDAVHSIIGKVTPTRDVFLHYAYLLMDYYNRQDQTGEIKQKKVHLLKKLGVEMT